RRAIGLPPDLPAFLRRSRRPLCTKGYRRGNFEQVSSSLPAFHPIPCVLASAAYTSERQRFLQATPRSTGVVQRCTRANNYTYWRNTLPVPLQAVYATTPRGWL